MKNLFCVLALCAAGLSCNRQSDDRHLSTQAVLPLTNAVSKLDEKGEATERVVYTTNGAVKHRTAFITGEGGRIMSSRTVDARGNLKWMEQYDYAATTDNRPVEIRRTKPNGEVVTVRFAFSADGVARKIVTGADGKQITEAEQSAFLEE